MKRKEFLEIVALAKLGTYKGGLGYEELTPFDGIALHRERRIASLNGMIRWLRIQCLQFDGEWDMEELENCQIYSQRIDLIPPEPKHLTQDLTNYFERLYGG